MTIKEIRDLAGMNRASFSREYHIPIRTLEDWETEKRKPPVYVLELLERVIKEDKEKE